jgi:fatty acid desaturase
MSGAEPGLQHAAVSTQRLSARDAKRIVDDLFELKPLIYWLDFLASTAITYAGLLIYVNSNAFSIASGCAFLIAAIGLFRVAIFMHEIVHMRRGHMRGFKIAWNVFVGIPLLTPSLFYTTHADHHSNRYYGTPADGEYLPFGRVPVAEIVRFMAMIPIVPVLAVLRALVLVPLSFAIPRLRRWLLEYASAAVISPTYRRRNVPSIRDPLWLVCDLACFAYAATWVVLAARGEVTLLTLGKLYLVVVFAIALNWLRTLAAHHYRNDGAESSHNAQVLDSINVEGHALLTEWLYPVGLRYHALHHLLPSLPYHALGIAHRRLLAELPENSGYRDCSSPGTLAALRQLWADAKASGPRGAEILRSWRSA